MASWLFRILHMPIGTPLPVLRPSDADGIKCSLVLAVQFVAIEAQTELAGELGCSHRKHSSRWRQ